MSQSIPEQFIKREVRSFVRREGRITDSQKNAMDTLWPIYGVEYASKLLDLPALFQNEAPVVFEIGFGNGDSLAEMAAANPEINYLGAEVYTAGVGHCLIAAKQRNLTNLKIISHDAIEILRDQIAENALAGVQLYFPDPWPKKKHYKRRIVNPSFLALIHQKIGVGGFFHFATDWQPYAEWALEAVEAEPGFVNRVGGNQFLSRSEFRPETKFERRGLRLGHGVWDLIYDTAEL